MKKLYIRLLFTIALSAALCGCRRTPTTETQTAKPVYPPARKDSTVDVYHGIKVPAPYRWLEDADAQETQEWVAQQNKLTSNFLSTATPRENIKARLTHLWNYPRYSAPDKEGGRYFFWKNDGLQNQSVLYMQKTLEGEPLVVINPNLLSEDGTVALTTTALSEDGTLLAYALSTSGSDWQEIKIRHIDSATDYNETIKWCKFAGIAWKHNNEGFFYDRFPEPNTIPPEDRNNYNRVYWHKLGTSQCRTNLSTNAPTTKN